MAWYLVKQFSVLMGWNLVKHRKFTLPAEMKLSLFPYVSVAKTVNVIRGNFMFPFLATSTLHFHPERATHNGSEFVPLNRPRVLLLVTCDVHLGGSPREMSNMTRPTSRGTFHLSLVLLWMVHVRRHTRCSLKRWEVRPLHTHTHTHKNTFLRLSYFSC
jgi:hypothetical protein